MYYITDTTITNKQREILDLIYIHRFMTRIQIQTLLNHTDYHRINAWLADLTQKECIGRIYTPSKRSVMEPAIYFYAKNGIQFQDDYYETFTKAEQQAFVRRIKNESQRTERCMGKYIALTDFFCFLHKKVKSSDKLEFEPGIEFKKSSDFEQCFPDAVIHVYPADIPQPTRYFVIFIDSHAPRRKLFNQLTQYSKMCRHWNEEDSDDLQLFIFICPDKTYQSYVRRKVYSLNRDTRGQPMMGNTVLRDMLPKKGVQESGSLVLPTP